MRQPVFENDVNQYGTQAELVPTPVVLGFENDVNQYGTQAFHLMRLVHDWFENDVNKDSFQSYGRFKKFFQRARGKCEKYY